MFVKKYPQRTILITKTLALSDLVTSKATVDLIFSGLVSPNGATGLDDSTAVKLPIKIKGSVVNNTATFAAGTFVTGTTYQATITIDGSPKAVAFLGETINNVYTLIQTLRNQIDPTSSLVDILLTNDGSSTFITIQSKVKGASHTLTYTAGVSNDLQNALEAGESFANYTPTAVAGTNGTTYDATIDVASAVAVSFTGIQASTYEMLRTQIANDMGANGVVTLLSDRIRIQAPTAAAYTAAYTVGTNDIAATANAAVGLYDGVAGSIVVPVLENASLNNPSRDVTTHVVFQQPDGLQKTDVKLFYDKTSGNITILPGGYAPAAGDAMILTAY